MKLELFWINTEWVWR